MQLCGILIFVSKLLYSGKVWPGESLARGKFGKLTLFEHLVKEKFGELIDQPVGY